MIGRILVAVALLLGATHTARATAVTTFGYGLQPCGAYLDDREQQNIDELAFIEWLGGYLSGVNATSTHTNNIMGDPNLKGAVYKLGAYCRAHPSLTVAVALYGFVKGWSSTTAEQADEAMVYGNGYKSCRTYLDSRMQQSPDQRGFIDWLGGYLSGVNAMSLNTNSALGDSELTNAVTWLDDYCRVNPGARFASAIGARVRPKSPQSLALAGEDKGAK